MTVLFGQGQCRSCGAPITWATSGSGKAIPLDATPTPDGNVELVAGQAKVWGSAHIWGADDVRHTSHFVTCPQAAEHRRSR